MAARLGGALPVGLRGGVHQRHPILDMSTTLPLQQQNPGGQLLRLPAQGGPRRVPAGLPTPEPHSQRPQDPGEPAVQDFDTARGVGRERQPSPGDRSGSLPGTTQPAHAPPRPQPPQGYSRRRVQGPAAAEAAGHTGQPDTRTAGLHLPRLAGTAAH